MRDGKIIYNRTERRDAAENRQRILDTASRLNEINAADQRRQDNIFKADAMLASLRSDNYLFQREVRGYSPKEIVEKLCATFIPSH